MCPGLCKVFYDCRYDADALRVLLTPANAFFRIRNIVDVSAAVLVFKLLDEGAAFYTLHMVSVEKAFEAYAPSAAFSLAFKTDDPPLCERSPTLEIGLRDFKSRMQSRMTARSKATWPLAAPQSSAPAPGRYLGGGPGQIGTPRKSRPTVGPLGSLPLPRPLGARASRPQSRPSHCVLTILSLVSRHERQPRPLDDPPFPGGDPHVLCGQPTHVHGHHHAAPGPLAQPERAGRTERRLASGEPDG